MPELAKQNVKEPSEANLTYKNKETSFMNSQHYDFSRHFDLEIL